jgi:hypothetical protein
MSRRQSAFDPIDHMTCGRELARAGRPAIVPRRVACASSAISELSSSRTLTLITQP